MSRSLTRDQQILLDRLDKLTELTESRFRIFGVRVGWDAVIGLIPGFGDAVSAALSVYVVLAGYRLGLSTWALARMGLNVLVDVALGSIPVIGDVFDALWRSNTRNLRLIHRELGV